MKDPAACCQAAGVSLPGGSLDSEHPEEGLGQPGEQRIIEVTIKQKFADGVTTGLMEMHFKCQKTHTGKTSSQPSWTILGRSTLEVVQGEAGLAIEGRY